jgi:catechol 2,3-dioxygenase-like lactoylglutathione lyase family enzyme
METNFSIDHIVIMVDDLAAAIEDYNILGFTVIEGGAHAANPTHNALVVFADGVYLEIIALRPGETSPRSTRLQKWIQAGPGLVDFALLPQDIEADIVKARARGLTIADAAVGGRLRPDGRQIAWKTANLIGPGLPFFCADVTPRSLRVPEGEVRRHPNGVTGAADLTIAVTDLTASARQYQALLGIEPQSASSTSTPEAKITTFSLGAVTLTLAQPDIGASPLHAYLTAGGERPYRLTLRAANLTALTTLDPNRAHGAYINLVGE